MTTENLPAVRNPEATHDVDSWIPVLQSVGELAAKIAGTEFVPVGLRNSVPATAAAILYGREVGLPPMTALTQTYVVNGKPSMSAEAMRALVLAAGHELEFVETTGALCSMRARRRGAESWQALTWSIDMARAAGLLGKDVWKSYPRAMLVARCTADLCRMVFPDVLHGFRALEEMQDMGPEDGDTAPAPQIAGPTTKVSRKRATRGSKSTAPPAEPRTEAPAIEGPPLPGEPGYDTPAAGASDDDTPPHGGDARETGEDAPAEPPTSDSEPSGDVVEGEVVEESTGPDPVPVGDAVQEVIPGRPMSKAQGRMQHGQFNALGVEDRGERLHITGVIVGREVESSNDLTHDEASVLIDTLGRAKDYNALNMILETIEQGRLELP